jgi:Fe-S-cluster-containing hydrogenase component 2
MIAPLGGYALKALVRETAVTVDRSRCVRHRCTTNACTRCMEACPTDAVSWGRGGIHMDSSACTQCLACLSVCPTAALASPGLSLPRLLSDLANHQLPVLGCNGQPDTEAHARLSCLGYLAHPELMVLCALVFPEGLHINLTACGGCPNGHVLDNVGAAHGRLKDLVPGHAVKLIRNREALDFQAPSLSRRQFFLFFRERSTRAAAAMVERLHGNGEQQSYGNKQVPAIRALLLKALAVSPTAKRRTIGNQLFGKISFTSDCVRSKRCVGVCPTGAIQSAGAGGNLPVTDQTLCVSCNSCQAFCRNQGVLISSND